MSNEGSRKDPVWKYAHLEKSRDISTFVCNFCSMTTKGGLHRVKQHLSGGYRNVTTCKNCPFHVKQEIREYMSKKKELKVQRNFVQEVEEEEEEEDGDLEVSNPRKRLSSSRDHQKNDCFESVQSSRKKPGPESPINAQSSVNDACKEEMREHTCLSIARWFYDAGIPLKACKYDSFGPMIEAMGQYGVGMKPPTYYELKGPLLKRELAVINKLMKSCKEEWAEVGCTIFVDRWTATGNKTLVNLLVNSPKGTMFIESIDASSYVKSGQKMFELLDRFVERIGEDNVVQVVTDSSSTNILAGRLLEAKRPHLVWSPCVAHCLDLILKDISKIPSITRTLKRGMEIRGYIYNHPSVLDMMRRFTNQKELDGPTKNQFANACVILSSIYCQKNNLITMFTSNEWKNSNWSKEEQGRRIVQSVLMPTFWTTTVFALKVLGPLVQVRKLVDSHKPIMGYIHKAMEIAKETIANSFNGKEEKYKYKDVIDIIDQRWELQLHRPLHAAGYYLNPEFFYSNPHIQEDCDVIGGLYSCISRLVHSFEIQDKILEELTLYRKAKRLFGLRIAIRQRNKSSPVEWWSSFGASTPNLQKFAMKVLRLAGSVSSCEHDWSVFEELHSKKRNRLAQNRLNDIVFIKYNRVLRRHYNIQDLTDPISLEEFNKSNEWLAGRIDGKSKEDDDSLLPWSDVRKAVEVEKPTYRSRVSVSKPAESASCSSTPIDVEVDSSETEEEDVENYMCDGYETAEEDVDDYESNGNETEGEEVDYYLSSGNESEEEEEEEEVPDNYKFFNYLLNRNESEDEEEEDPDNFKSFDSRDEIDVFSDDEF